MALLPEQEATLKALDNPKSQASKMSRLLDFMILPIVLFALIAAYHVHAMLTMGDWDFWVDWKDRQYWVTVAPITLVMLPAAVAAIFWDKFRLPIAGTVMAICLLIGEWINRYFGFHLWTYFPMNFVWPAQIIPGLLMIDLALAMTRNVIATSIIGGMMMGLLFYPTNWPMLAAFHLPVQYQGTLLTVADLQGFVFTRTATPEYLRIVERGTLRTFGGHSAPIAAFFSAFVCVILFFIWWHIGKFIANLGWINNGMKRFMGFKRTDHVQPSEGLTG
ncbi:MAG: bacterial ammonia monooxygenase, subunit AmoA [Rhizobiaceae bacterium]